MKAHILQSNKASLVAALQPRPTKAVVSKPAARDLQFIFAFCVVAFFIVACVARVARRQWLVAVADGQSPLAEAKSAAAMVVEFVSMS